MEQVNLWRCLAFIFFIAIGVNLSGCAKTTVVLLPDPDGKVGKLSISNEAGSVDIDKAGEATTVRGKQSLPSRPEVLPEEKITAKYGDVLASLPEQPVHFILYFRSGSTTLTPESVNKIPEIMETINQRQSQSISVVGHADTAGNRQYNLRLSKQRADAVGRILAEKGIMKIHIKTTSHGEENPLIKTADNVNEPRNRRVEVIVR